jgi:fatty-acyl-CoA synthase
MTSTRRGRVAFDIHARSSIELPVADHELTLGRSLLWSVDRYGTRPAMVASQRRWTYEELASDVEQCARALIVCGVTKGSRVGLLLGARAEFVIAAYATAIVGGISVFISTFSSGEDLEWILRHSDTSLLIGSLLIGHEEVRGRRVRLPRPGGASLPFLGRVVPVGEWDGFLSLGDDCPPAVVAARCKEVVPTDDAILLYTSGSTSTPKAVLHTHRSPVMQGFHMADCMAIGSEDRAFTSFPLFWTAGWLTGVAAPFAAGACTVLQEVFDPVEAGALIERERITSLRQMVHDEHRLVAAETEQPHDLSSVNVGVVTEPLRARTSMVGEPAEICAWGMTETFAIATILPFDAPLELRRTTMGLPVPGNRIRIRDQVTGETLGPGQVGEITVAGKSLMRGYYKADDPLPTDEAGYLRTGDAGQVRADGYLIFAGRLDRLIKTAGVNVSPIEIEEHLLSWGGVGTCAVVGVPHPSLGTAVVLCAARRGDGRHVHENEIKAVLRDALPSYKVPHTVLFLEESEFTLTPSSKVDIGALMPLVIARLLESDIDRTWRAILRNGADNASAD